MQCAQDNQEDVTCVVMWVRRAKGKEVDKYIWDDVEQLRQVTKEQPTNHQEMLKFINTPNLTT